MVENRMLSSAQRIYLIAEKERASDPGFLSRSLAESLHSVSSSRSSSAADWGLDLARDFLKSDIVDQDVNQALRWERE